VTSLDSRGFLAEAPTENVGIVTRAGAVVLPDLLGILAGTTMLRVAELARELVAAGRLGGVAFRDISLDDMKAAAEILIVGTTRDVIAVTEFDGQPMSGGKPGPVWRLLSERLVHDTHHNASLRTSIAEQP
jgi:branched-chain amino acid aminotransferase